MLFLGTQWQRWRTSPSLVNQAAKQHEDIDLNRFHDDFSCIFAMIDSRELSEQSVGRIPTQLTLSSGHCLSKVLAVPINCGELEKSNLHITSKYCTADSSTSTSAIVKKITRN